MDAEKRRNFISAVFRRFVRHRGLLISGAIAYYFLLSILPLMILVFVGLSKFVGEEELIHVLTVQLELALAANAEPLIETIRAAFEARGVIGWVGLGVIVFVASAIFRILEEAMEIVFETESVIRKNHIFLAVIKPFLLLSIVLLGLLLLTLGTTAFQSLSENSRLVREHPILSDNLLRASLYVASFLAQIILFAAIYKVLPPVRISKRLALLGGFFAAVAWEGSRAFLVWYFSALSIVNVVYGSLAPAVIILFGFELIAVILLMGAEVIAEAQERRWGRPDWSDSGNEDLPAQLKKG